MICRSILLVLVVALHGIIIIVRPQVDAGRPKKHASARQSTATELETLPLLASVQSSSVDPTAFDDARQQRCPRQGPKKQQDYASCYQVATPYSAAEQEVAQFMSSGGLASLPPLPLPDVSLHQRHAFTRTRRKRQSSTTKASSEVQDDKEAGQSSQEPGQSGNRNDDILVETQRGPQTRARTAAMNRGKRESKMCGTSESNPDQNRGEETARGEEDINPVYLQNVAPTKVGKLFQGFERRYWDARQKGLFHPQDRRKFFKTSRLGLTKVEREEFRQLSRRFLAKLRIKSEKDKQYDQAYRLRRFGPKEASQKTEEQKRVTRRTSRKAVLIRRLRRIVASPDQRDTLWTEEQCSMLQELNKEAPLEANELLVALYRDVLAANKAMKSCITLPD